MVRIGAQRVDSGVERVASVQPPDPGLMAIRAATKVHARARERGQPLSQSSHRRGDSVKWIIRLIGVADYGESDSVNGALESRPREWREIDHVPPMGYGRARIFKKKHDLRSARCIEIIGDCPYVK